jgi:peptidoglycan/xylan/chitin deacetylase (PgdA/CDA1 family)
VDRPALVSLTFDDGLRCQLEQAVPVLNQYGFHGTFFPTANTDSVHEAWRGAVTRGWRKITWSEGDISELRKMIVTGHEIGSHSISHHAATMREHPDDEARKSKQLIKDWVGMEPSSFCYPYYISHSYLAAAVERAGYEQARGGHRASYYTIPEDSSFDRFNVDCRQAKQDDVVSEWIRPNCWHILTFHGIGDEHCGWMPIGVDRFRAMMAELAGYQDKHMVEIVTFKEGAERFRRTQ